jgi:transposase-like protein
MGLSSYKAAWSWLQRYRKIIKRCLMDPLSGEIEFEEFEIKHKLIMDGSEETIFLVAAAEVKNNCLGKTRLTTVPILSSRYLLEFIGKNIKPGSTLITDSRRAYAKAKKSGYKRTENKIGGNRKTSELQLPHVHQLKDIFWRWLNKKYPGPVELKDFQDYLDEFSFLFDGRIEQRADRLFDRIMKYAVK